MDGHTENRQHRRIALNQRGFLSYNATHVISCFICDVSAGGAKVISDHPLDLDLAADSLVYVNFGTRDMEDRVVEIIWSKQVGSKFYYGLRWI